MRRILLNILHRDLISALCGSRVVPMIRTRSSPLISFRNLGKSFFSRLGSNYQPHGKISFTTFVHNDNPLSALPLFPLWGFSCKTFSLHLRSRSLKAASVSQPVNDQEELSRMQMFMVMWVISAATPAEHKPVFRCTLVCEPQPSFFRLIWVTLTLHFSMHWLLYSAWH